MIADLEDQLHFVKHVQSVDTEGVEPLVAIRDETEEAKRSSEVTVERLKGEFEKEKRVGFAGRIRRRKDVKEGEKEVENGKRFSYRPLRQTQRADGEEKDGWELLSQAPNKQGRFVVVDTKNQ